MSATFLSIFFCLNNVFNFLCAFFKPTQGNELELYFPPYFRPLQQLTTEIERNFKINSVKIEQLRVQKDQRAFKQHLKLDEIKSTIEKARHQ